QSALGGTMPDFATERRCEGVVCGVDEAGRGPLAGPVVAAAVIIDRQRFRGWLRAGLDDSKAMTREAREQSYQALFRCARIGLGATPHHRRSFEPVRLALGGELTLLDLIEAKAAADD